MFRNKIFVRLFVGMFSTVLVAYGIAYAIYISQSNCYGEYCSLGAAIIAAIVGIIVGLVGGYLAMLLALKSLSVPRIMLKSCLGSINVGLALYIPSAFSSILLSQYLQIIASVMIVALGSALITMLVQKQQVPSAANSA